MVPEDALKGKGWTSLKPLWHEETVDGTRAQRFAAVRGVRYHKSMAVSGEVNARNKRRRNQRRKKRRGAK